MSDAAITCLMIFLNVAPIGLYFLILGLVNSHARPHRVSSRADFVALTSVMIPLLFWPIPALVVSRMWWLLAVGLCAAVIAFVRLLPRRDAGWVVYNLSEGRWRRTLENACRGAGLQGEWSGRTWREASGAMSLTYNYLSVLRNVSVNVDAASQAARGRADELARRLDEQFLSIEQLPSTSGACLLVLGVMLMVVPLWVLGQHAQDVAATVARLWG